MENNKTKERKKLKEIQGIVVSEKMAKTVIIEVRNKVIHPTTKKMIEHTRRIKVHDPKEEAHLGDSIVVSECRHFSKDKYHRLVRISGRAK